MYAIITTGGRQYWVEPGELLRVEKLAGEPGTEITFEALWSAGDGDGAARARGGKVVAEVVRGCRGPKIIVFKKRTKKAYQKTQGHRQDLTEIRIKSISPN